MTTTAPLFPDLPVPAPSKHAPPITYLPRCKPLRTAQYFSRALVESTDAQRKTECYLKMIAAVLAKDGA